MVWGSRPLLSAKSRKEMNRSTFDEISFGDIRPGDRCVVMTTCTGHSNMYRAIFRGMRNARCVVDIEDSRSVLVDKKGNPYDWDAHYKELPYPRYVRETYVDDISEYTEKTKERQKNYSWVQEVFLRRSTLKRNNIIKLA